MDTTKPKFTSKTAARAWLRARYVQQCQLYPATTKISEELYVRRNLRAAMAMTLPDSTVDYCQDEEG